MKSAEDKKAGSPKAPRSGRRRSGAEIVERLRDAASAEFGSNGYSRTTTAGIAQRAGVSENLLFKHFGSKANLFNGSIFEPIEEHFAEFSREHVIGADNRREVSERYIGEMQAFIREHADAIMLLIMSKSFEPGEVNGIDKVSSLHRYFEDAAKIVSDRLPAESPIDPRLVACISFSTILSCELFADWLFPAGWGTPEEIQDAVAKFVLGGFVASVLPS